MARLRREYRDDAMADAQDEHEAAQDAAEVAYMEQRAKAAGRPECPLCHQHRGTTRLGGNAVWCTYCDEPATG